MTEEIKIYRTKVLMKSDKKIMNSRGFRALHTDFINNDDGVAVLIVQHQPTSRS